jgi:hypothetical protein
MGARDRLTLASAGGVQGDPKVGHHLLGLAGVSPIATVSPDSSRGHAPAVKTILEQPRVTAA